MALWFGGPLQKVRMPDQKECDNFNIAHFLNHKRMGDEAAVVLPHCSMVCVCVCIYYLQCLLYKQKAQQNYAIP